MSNIPTAEEFLQDSFTISHFYNDKYNRMSCFSDDVQKAMIEFAKLHVEQALKEASEIKLRPYNVPLENCFTLHKEILEAYPLKNIK